MRRTLVLTLVLSAGLLVATATQAAAQTLTPASHDFGNTLQGRSSAFQVYTLTAGPGPGNYVADLKTSNPEFRLAQDPNGVTACGVLAPFQSCTFAVYFFPTKLGPQTGTISGNTGGPHAQVSGTGIPHPSAKKKKCKKGKKRAAAAKKKCKKKK